MLSAPKPCTVCQILVRDGSARCAAHKVRPGQFADRARGSRHERGYGAAWDKLREQILARDSGLCQCDECKAEGRVLSATEVDHRVNKAAWRRLHGSLAGVDHPSNLQAINSDCHKRKTQTENRPTRGRGERMGQ